jgi:hypothetical protein
MATYETHDRNIMLEMKKEAESRFADSTQPAKLAPIPGTLSNIYQLVAVAHEAVDALQYHLGPVSTDTDFPTASSDVSEAPVCGMHGTLLDIEASLQVLVTRIKRTKERLAL